MQMQSTLITLSLFAIAAFASPASGKDLETDVSEARQPFHEKILEKGGIQDPSVVLVSENSDKRLPTNLTSFQCEEGRRQNKELPSPKTALSDPKKDKQETALTAMKILGPGMMLAAVCAGFGLDWGLGGAVLGGIMGGLVGLGLGMIKVINGQEPKNHK